MEFINLRRHFRDLTTEELGDPTGLALLSEAYSGGLEWGELLQSRRVLMLAEAGSGKTREMQAAAARLVADGKAAFFLPIETLHGEDMRDVLAMEPGVAERLDAWLPSDEPGWFFLDAVDELKLVHGKLDTALGKVSRALGGARSRAHLVISCRPTDWRPVADMDTINKRFPPRAGEAPTTLTGEAAFLAPFEERGEKSQEESTNRDLRCVVLFPLNPRQMREFAIACGVTDPDPFMKEIDRHDAWSFARRPLDLSELAAVWKANGRLGTRLEQHEIDVENNLKDRPDRPDDAVLSRDRAHEGAERLALALALTRTRTIRAPEHEIQQDREVTSLNAADILTDWTDGEVQTLLRRAIFDPATYGRVRFHHRSVQEFLAARRLATLRQRGMTARQLERMLFADRYGERVAIPSMSPVSAWLARTDANVCRELLAREPENLIVFGDPESLPFDIRASLLDSFVAAYGGGGWRGLHVPSAEARRLAQADLAPIIRKCWQGNHTNQEVHEFLLQLIWLGEIADCMDIAREAAFDERRSRTTRGLAILGLAAGKRDSDLREIAVSMLNRPEAWPDKLVYSRIDQLFPGALTVDELEQLLRRVREPRDTTSGFGWSLYELVNDVDPISADVTFLRDMLTALVWDGREVEAAWHKPSSRFGYLTSTVARLCRRQFEAGLRTMECVRAWVIANRFHGQNHLAGDDLKALRRYAAEGDAALRKALFCAEMAIATVIETDKDPGRQFFVMCHGGVLPHLVASDWAWIRELIQEAIGSEKRIAVYAAIHVWAQRGQNGNELEQIRTAVADDAELLARIARETTPREPDPSWAEHKREMAAREAECKEREHKERCDWLRWRARIMADPDRAFSKAKRNATTVTLIKWLRIERRSRNTIAEARWPDIRDAFGDAIADRFEAELKRYWRAIEPPVASRRSREDQNSITGQMILGLTGLLVEATTDPGWIETLDADLARRAAEWATIEWSTPAWLVQVAAAYPFSVADALKIEVEHELAREGHPSTLSSIEHGSEDVKTLMGPVLKPLLRQVRFEGVERLPHRTSTLDVLLSILARTHKRDIDIANRCYDAFLADPSGTDALAWLGALALCDLCRALEAMKLARERLQGEERERWSILWLGSLFGMGGRSRHVPLDGDAELLMDLVRFAYTCVRRGDDAVHEGSWTPDARDDAETARNQVLTALLDKPGAEAHAAMLRLADDPLFAHIRDRLRIKARERAALDSEPAPVPVSALKAFEKKYERPPASSRELAEVLLDRLSDIEYDLWHHDYSDRHVLRELKEEKDIQPLLARRLHDAAGDAYRVSREEEVADRKQTDIRLAATAFNGRAVIEIKIGDNNYSIAALEDALEVQLLGQYLRHAECCVGCLLVTYAGRKEFKNPDGSGMLSFEETIARLQGRASELQECEQGRVRISVVGLDLRETGCR